ncbi:MAG: immunoglobulin domain-containing protein, partial [Bacteroidetes bacterium]|nr:immunoglobulin domain-containing protein [Bacteroidota bacterium]
MIRLIRSLFPLLCFLYSTIVFAQPQYFNSNVGNTSNVFPLGSTTNKVQWIYGPGLFNSNGPTGTPAPAGFITTVYFRLGSLATASTYSDYTISLGQNVGTTTSFPSNTYITGLTQCLYSASFTMTGATANSWYAVSLPTFFLYNPSQSLVFELTTSSSGSNYVSQVNGTGNQRIWGTYGSAIGTSTGTGLVDFGFDLIPPTPCSGKPNAGVASYVPGCPAMVKLTGNTFAANMTIQWQKKVNCGGVWTNIPGATSYAYNIGSQSVPTSYRAFLVCTTSGQSDTSNAVLVNSVSPCYCTSAATYGTYHNITNVTLGTLNNSSICSSGYTNFAPTVAAPRLIKGDQYPISITATNCGASTLSYGVAAFIDFDGDGTYALTERVFATASMYSTSPFNVSGTISIPTSQAFTGITGMRVILAYNVAGTSITGCQSSTYGETEDYVVNIQEAPNVTGTGLVNYQGTYCAGSNVVLTGSSLFGGTPSFLWKKPNGTWDTSTTLTINNIQPSQSGNYYLYLLKANACPGSPVDTSAPRWVQLTVNPVPPMPTVASVITYCQNDPFDSIHAVGVNLKWYTVPSGGVAGPNPMINTSIGGTYTFYVSQTIDGCESPRKQVTVTVSPKPPMPTATSPVGYCQGDPSIPLSAQGQNLRWYSVATGGAGTPIAPTPSTQGQGSTTWYVTQTIDG